MDLNELVHGLLQDFGADMMEPLVAVLDKLLIWPWMPEMFTTMDNNSDQLRHIMQCLRRLKQSISAPTKSAILKAAEDARMLLGAITSPKGANPVSHCSS
jgi:hypothetical protein